MLLEKAVTLAERKEYDKALLVLSNIPEGVPQWKEADELAYSIYFSKIDLEAETLLHKAKIALAQNDYEKALEHISVISPQSRFFPDAQEMVSDIKAENDQVKALQAQVAALSTERDALKEDKAKAEQELHRFTASQRDAIDAENRSVEKKLTDWLLGSSVKRQ